MKPASLLSLFALAFTLSACAHGTMRGSVAMKISDDEAHVCLGDNEVKAGDKVAFFKNVCLQPKGGKLAGTGEGAACRLTRLGEGQVLQTLNDHYSVVKANPGVTFEEGTLVEKE